MGQMGSGTFSMEDYAWGATGLDDIITQVRAWSDDLFFSSNMLKY